ncbi:hypothetical protein [Porphyromonas levii]|uniref:hypothetical protein n=1 Tax=Porphyromonas levii TaxID=28114 RepID=UPI001B8B111E|nr:hypothetical protein [Porphyromonas levii]MBR8713883.1 hypothetical protein [Porphyromonas levii]MBR8715897.1 hypothetical protein [Porphyromonas levii]MBR8728445.1 hypothetical protein [Porphyromonas levii]MBR8736755.1 hypothetical protein [Porphyromonas levii]MBR8769891.1 hypothetical protein [Porphyromonas levii]
MNTTTILNTLLILAIVWVSVAILYLIVSLVTHLATRCRSKLRFESEKTTEKEEALTSLVGKCRPYIPPANSNDFPTLPATSSSEKAVENIDTFASELPEQSGDSVAISEEENELLIDYSDDMEEVDLEQNEREALLIFDESSATEPPHSGGILVRELARLQQASQKEELDEEETEAVRETITKLQGTDLMEQYNKNFVLFEERNKGLMKVIREVEEKEQNKATESQTLLINNEESKSSTSDEQEERPLSYYL